MAFEELNACAAEAFDPLIWSLEVLTPQETALQFQFECRGLPTVVYQLDNISGMMPPEGF